MDTIKQLLDNALAYYIKPGKIVSPLPKSDSPGGINDPTQPGLDYYYQRENANEDLAKKNPIDTAKQSVFAANTKVSNYQETPQLDPSSPWDDFVKRAKRVAQLENYPVSVLLSQAAVESGRAKAAPGNNFFGLKGIGNAGSQHLATSEAGRGGFYNTVGNFAAFKTPEDSMRAYINLIKKQYPDAYAQKSNPAQMVQSIAKGGYATNPDYAGLITQTPEFQTFAGGND